MRLIMPRKRQEAPLTEAEIAFMGAIDRLLAGEPKTEELRKRARRGRLKINVTTVSTEAGYARTYLYKFPSVRVQARLEEIVNPPSATRTAEDVIRALRMEIQELRRERDLAIDAARKWMQKAKKMGSWSASGPLGAVDRLKHSKPNRDGSARDVDEQANVIPLRTGNHQRTEDD
jgi:hypothetical protein